MAHLAPKLMIVFCALAFLAGGCAKHEAPSALYVLEELEAASAVKDPAGKVERLTIFIGNHKDSQYRFIAYNRALEALSTEMKDDAKAAQFLAGALAKETEPAARGELLLAKFGYLMEKDKNAAVAFADSLFAAERSARLFLYMGYELMDPKADPDLAAKCFLKSADLSVDPHAKANANANAGAVFDQQGKKEEAKKYLAMAALSPEADGLLANILWSEGKRDEALDLYIRGAAGMPGARAEEKLDSLYAIVHPDAKDLGERIMALRIGDEGPLPGAAFVDLDGRAYDLAKLKGTKIVINALSPT
jgi:hypothetical protein